MQLFYILALVISIGCLSLIDRKYSLAFFYDMRRTLLVMAISVGVFVLWDIAGIALGIFYQGSSPYALDFVLFPEFPIEELLFLFLLCYVSLLAYRFVQKRQQP